MYVCDENMKQCHHQRHDDDADKDYNDNDDNNQVQQLLFGSDRPEGCGSH